MVASIMTIALPTSIIGANFMTEWQVQQRLQVQQKMRRKQRKLQSSNHLNTSGKFDEHRQHAFNYKLLMEQNGVMLSSIAEIQEKLNDINPPHYYIRFKECHAQCEFLHKRIAALEKQLAGYHEQDQQQKSQNAVAEHNSIHSTRNYSGHGPSFLQRIRERALYNTHHISECDESATEDHTPPLKRRRKSLTTWIKQHIRMSTYSDHSAAAVAGRFPLGWHPKSSIPPAPLKQLKRSYSLPDSFNNRHTRHNHQNHTEIEQTLTPHNSARPFSYA
jgi:hypothetical protein